MSKCIFYKPYMDTLKLLVKEYYGLADCCCGGPLHILLDDDNYGTDDIHFCIKHCFEDLDKSIAGEDPWGYSPEVRVLGIMICNEYAKMSLEERACFDAYICGQTLECPAELTRVNGTRMCSECDNILGDLYEWIKEKEN